MHKLDRFVLTLGRPSHGWLPFRLELGNFVVDDAASAVLNDPVEELLDLLAYSASPNQTDARVCFWLEPAGYALDASFIATGALLSSRI